MKYYKKSFVIYFSFLAIIGLIIYLPNSILYTPLSIIACVLPFIGLYVNSIESKKEREDLDKNAPDN